MPEALPHPEKCLLQRFAISGAGPTGLHTLAALIDSVTPLSIAVYEAADQAGVGMPYDDNANLARFASMANPELTLRSLDSSREQTASFLPDYGNNCWPTAMNDRRLAMTTPWSCPKLPGTASRSPHGVISPTLA